MAFSNYLREHGFKSIQQEPGRGEMSFVDHLEALRWHIVRSAFAIVIVAIAIFIKINWIFEKVISGPIRPDFRQLYRFMQPGKEIGHG